MTSCKQRGTLWLVSTPIGNLKDITLRALDVLKSADIIVCEDTRVTRKLLQAYTITPPQLWTYHEHNARVQRPKIHEALWEGKTIALVSDAGTPLISDPGFKLVKECQEKGFPVTAAPGVSAVTTALSLSGLATNEFYFAGFVPRKSGGRQRFFKSLSIVYGTLVFYESARRVVATLKDMKPFFEGRDVALARELTKRFEEVKRCSLGDLIADLDQRSSLKGEIVLLVGPPVFQEVSCEDLDTALNQAMATKSLREAVSEISTVFGISRKKVYERALAHKSGEK